jgi:hypothetical protein
MLSGSLDIDKRASIQDFVSRLADFSAPIRLTSSKPVSGPTGRTTSEGVRPNEITSAFASIHELDEVPGPGCG